MTVPPGPFSPADAEQICRVLGEAVTGSEIPNLIVPSKPQRHLARRPIPSGNGFLTPSLKHKPASQTGVRLSGSSW